MADLSIQALLYTDPKNVSKKIKYGVLFNQQHNNGSGCGTYQLPIWYKPKDGVITRNERGEALLPITVDVQGVGLGAKTITFEISVALGGDIAQRCQVSHCAIRDWEFSHNGGLKCSPIARSHWICFSVTMSQSWLHDAYCCVHLFPTVDRTRKNQI